MRSLTVPHEGRALCDSAHIAGLLLELSHGCLLGCLALIDESGGDLDHDLVRWRSVLFLEHNFGSWTGPGALVSLGPSWQHRYPQIDLMTRSSYPWTSPGWPQCRPRQCRCPWAGFCARQIPSVGSFREGLCTVSLRRYFNISQIPGVEI